MPHWVSFIGLVSLAKLFNEVRISFWNETIHLRISRLTQLITSWELLSGRVESVVHSVENGRPLHSFISHVKGGRSSRKVE